MKSAVPATPGWSATKTAANQGPKKARIALGGTRAQRILSPGRRKMPRPRASQGGFTIEPIDLARLAHEACVNTKATDIRLLDVTGLTIVADFFLIATANSATHARAVGEAVREAIKEKTGRNPLGMEGLVEGWWVLLDFGDILVHVFQEEARKFYALDETWADAQVV